MQRYSLIGNVLHAFGGQRGRQPAWRSPELKPSYDVVVIGGGGHGLATAYFLAKAHGIRKVAVRDRKIDPRRGEIPAAFC
jgi:sarcosine oxidase subunit beta